MRDAATADDTKNAVHMLLNGFPHGPDVTRADVPKLYTDNQEHTKSGINHCSESGEKPEPYSDL